VWLGRVQAVRRAMEHTAARHIDQTPSAARGVPCPPSLCISPHEGTPSHQEPSTHGSPVTAGTRARICSSGRLSTSSAWLSKGCRRA